VCDAEKVLLKKGAERTELSGCGREASVTRASGSAPGRRILRSFAVCAAQDDTTLGHWFVILSEAKDLKMRELVAGRATLRASLGAFREERAGLLRSGKSRA
jgi:hypothetical protein